MRVIVLCMTALALTAAVVSSEAEDRVWPVADSCPEAPEARYFPIGVFWPYKTDLFVRQWYSKHLAAMEEPSLSCGAVKDTETYRFLWLRTWDNPVAVRVFRRGDDYGLEAAILNGAGGYDPGHVSRRVTKTLSHDQWQTVIARLEEVQFWKMATKSDHLPGLDGAQWIVEARRDGRYHIADRWTGTDHGLESVGRHFLDLAGLGDVGSVD